MGSFDYCADRFYDMRLYTKIPLFNEIRSNACLISLLLFIVLLTMSCDMQSPRKQNYGLNSSDDHFLYSYFLTNSELFVKTRADFDKQFDPKEYKELRNKVETIYESSGRYM